MLKEVFIKSVSGTFTANFDVTFEEFRVSTL